MKPKTRLEWFLAKIAGDADATGSVTPKTRKEFYLKEIADNGGGGGSSLPAVTASDNGSVLAVVDGAWDKAAPDPYPGYDVVISTTEISTDASNYSIVKYNEENVLAKVRAGELVTGVLFYHYNYNEDIIGDTDVDLIPLAYSIFSPNADFSFQHVGPKDQGKIYALRVDLTIVNDEITVRDAQNWNKTLS